VRTAHPTTKVNFSGGDFIFLPPNFYPNLSQTLTENSSYIVRNSRFYHKTGRQKTTSLLRIEETSSWVSRKKLVGWWWKGRVKFPFVYLSFVLHDPFHSLH